METFVVDGHHGANALGSTGDAEDEAQVCVRFAFYNVGIQNPEVSGTKWDDKRDRLAKEIRTLCTDGVDQCEGVFLSEFGNMTSSIALRIHTRAIAKHTRESQSSFSLPSAGPHRVRNIDTTPGYVRGDTADDSVRKFFEGILRDNGLSTYMIYLSLPYVALIDSSLWRVLSYQTLLVDVKEEKQRYQNCKNKVQQMLLEIKVTRQRVQVMNCHFPTSICTSVPQKNKGPAEDLD